MLPNTRAACFPEFLAFYPALYEAIDWARGHEMLDKELQRVLREAEQTRRTIDKLVRVWRRDGREEWVLIHVEVQNQDEADFAQRVFVYHYRLFGEESFLEGVLDESACHRLFRRCTHPLDPV